MRLLRSAVVLVPLVLGPLAGCLGGDGKGPEEELDGLDDSKTDSHRKPTDHGPIAFGQPAASALTDIERFHAWTFELSGDATVDMTTSYAVLGQRRTDTVLYLYKEGATGWGAYIARNDDYGATTYSKLIRELGAGRYRVLVKGHQAATRGKFKLTVGCTGDGCAAVDPDACLFGETYGDIEGNPALQIINTHVITAANLDTLGPIDQQRLVRAVHESAHTDVTTPQEALSRVDQGEVNVTWIAEPAARRMFVAFEYGAGDNSYGAIFDKHSDARATSIHDGDLYDCEVRREVCLLPEDWNALRSSTAFVRTTSRVVTQASQLSGVAVDQALGAFRQSYDDVTSVADGLSRVDDNELEVVTFRHAATGTQLDVFAYHAGDTSVGVIYRAGTTTAAGLINDLFIEGCTLFE